MVAVLLVVGLVHGELLAPAGHAPGVQHVVEGWKYHADLLRDKRARRQRCSGISSFAALGRRVSFV
eukprot:498472-Pyramimonas_sp.AAC.2